VAVEDPDSFNGSSVSEIFGWDGGDGGCFEFEVGSGEVTVLLLQLQ